MGGRSVSGYADESVVERLHALAKAESRAPSSIVGQALGFYVGLPEAARISLRRIDALGNTDERAWVLDEFIRLILKADMNLTQRRMAEDIGTGIPKLTNDEELERTALAWSATSMT